MSIPRRRIGGMEAGVIGLGCMRLAATGDARDQSVALLREAAAAGVTMFDTADAYGWGENELLLGEALADLQDTVTIATKVGLVWPDAGPGEVDGTPENIVRAAHGSLRRLGADRIGLLYLHRVDPTVPIEESVGAMAQLVASGDVAAIGLCEASVDTLRRAAAVHPISALQSEWSMWSRDIEPEILPEARRLGIGIVAYSPLGRGFFTNRRTNWDELPPTDFRRTGARYTGENLRRNEDALQRVRALADDLGVTVSQLSLAWLLARGSDVVPIPGASRAEQLRENLRAATVVLRPEIEEALAEVIRPGSWSGERYPEGTLLTYSTTPPLSSGDAAGTTEAPRS